MTFFKSGISFTLCASCSNSWDFPREGASAMLHSVGTLAYQMKRLESSSDLAIWCTSFERFLFSALPRKMRYLQPSLSMKVMRCFDFNSGPQSCSATRTANVSSSPIICFCPSDEMESQTSRCTLQPNHFSTVPAGLKRTAPKPPSPSSLAKQASVKRKYTWSELVSTVLARAERIRLLTTLMESTAEGTKVMSNGGLWM